MGIYAYKYYLNMKFISFGIYDDSTRGIRYSSVSRNKKILSSWEDELRDENNLITITDMKKKPDEYIYIQEGPIIYANSGIWHEKDYILIHYVDDLYIKIPLSKFNNLPRP